jgi:membrane associated rhomboid family serine protease
VHPTLGRKIPFVTDTETPREPALNLPGALTVLVVVLVGIHLFKSILPPESEQWLILTFGFIPARYDTSVLIDRFAEFGGEGAKFWGFVTYSFLHADLTHLAFNVLWLLPFGSAVARRFGAIRFFLFLAVASIAGAAAHLVTHARELAPMIGASAAISGAMAAAIRFAFGRGSSCRSGAAMPIRRRACRRCRCSRRCATRVSSPSSPSGSASTSSSASARSRSERRRKASPGRRTSAVLPQGCCYSRCSTRSLPHRETLRIPRPA